MGKLKRMDQVLLILETYISTQSIKATARRLQLSKNTVRQYIRRATSVYSDIPEELSKIFLLSVEEQEALFYGKPKELSERETLFMSKVPYWTKELGRLGVTRQLLWEEYKSEHPDGYEYSQFCERLRAVFKQRNLTIAMKHKAGEVMQLDFAGKHMSWVDASSGEVHDCEILVAVMPYSHHTFAMALPSQKVMDFVEGINQAFLFYGKLPKVILSDNLKSYVTRADRYEPKFNDLCVQLAAHYQIDLDATRVAKPKDKGSVENMVSTVYTRIYAPLRNEVFHSIEELNEAIRHQLNLHNAKPYQKRIGSRQLVFEQEELPQMSNLPSDLFEVKRTTKAKVQNNYHILLGEESNYYSVPYKYVGKYTTVLYDSKTVEIYLDNQRISTHRRLKCKDCFFHQTNESHMPRSHQEWQKAKGYDANYFLDRAVKIGTATHWAIGQVLLSRMHEPQSYKSCQGILALAKKYTPQRLDAACQRCQINGKVNYTMLKRILSRHLDQQTLQSELFSIPEHENIRGPEAYK